MKRGDLYRVAKPSTSDPKKFRVFVVVGRQVVIDSRFSTVICAPVYTARHGLSTQVPLGNDDGLRHDSAVHCDELVSLPKAMLTNFVATLSAQKIRELDKALVAAVGVNAAALHDDAV